MGSRVSVVEEIPSEYPQHDLVWSLRPVIYAMRISGIDLDLSQRPSVLRRWIFLTIAMLSCFTILYVNAVYFIPLLYILKSDASTKNLYLHISVLSDEIINSIFTGLTFTMIFLKWGTIWNQLQEMEKFIGFPAHFYKQIRKSIVASFIVPFILVNFASVNNNFDSILIIHYLLLTIIRYLWTCGVKEISLDSLNQQLMVTSQQCSLHLEELLGTPSDFSR